MNVVLTRLSLHQFTCCPVFGTSQSFKVFNSYVSKSFSPFFRGEGRLSVEMSSFKDFLSHPIAFVSCISRINNPDSTVTVTNSHFCSCSSNEPGGAIYTTHNNATVVISNCVFHDCSSTGSVAVSFISSGMYAGGGGCALLCSKFYVTKCCFSNCFSVERGPALFTASNGFEDAVFNTSVIVCATGGICPIHFGKGRDIMSNVNSTLNTCNFLPGGAFTYSGISNILQYSNIFHGVSTQTGLSFPSRAFDFALGSTEETCRMCNVVNNSNQNIDKCTIYSYHQQITFIGFVFYQNDAPIFQKMYGSIIIKDCVSDTSQIGSVTESSGNTIGTIQVSLLTLSIPDVCNVYRHSVQRKDSIKNLCNFVFLLAAY